MIDIKIVNSIIDFYFQTRGQAWGIMDAEGKNLKLPSDPTNRAILNSFIEILTELKKISENKAKLLEYCQSLEQRETKAINEHRTGGKYNPLYKVSDYPLMACALRAIRSYVLDTIYAQEQIENPRTLESIRADIQKHEEKVKEKPDNADRQKNLKKHQDDLVRYKAMLYYKSDKSVYGEDHDHLHGFIDVIKYEDKSKYGKKLFQHIQNFNEFYNTYTQAPFGVLKRIQELLAIEQEEKSLAEKKEKIKSNAGSVADLGAFSGAKKAKAVLDGKSQETTESKVSATKKHQ